MFCGLPGRYDPAGALAAERRSDEERPSRSHPDDLDTLLVIGEAGVDLLEAVRIFEGCDRVHKIYAMLTNVLGGFALVPIILHARFVPDTGTAGKLHEPREPHATCGDLV